MNFGGNRQIDFGEQCEPPGRPCMYEDKGVSTQGICESDCKCAAIPEVVAEEKPNETGGNAAAEVKENTVKEDTVKKETAEESAQSNEPKTGRGIVRVVLGVIILAATAFLVYFFFRKREGGSNPIDEMEKMEENEEH